MASIPKSKVLYDYKNKTKLGTLNISPSKLKNVSPEFPVWLTFGYDFLTSVRRDGLLLFYQPIAKKVNEMYGFLPRVSSSDHPLTMEPERHWARDCKDTVKNLS